MGKKQDLLPVGCELGGRGTHRHEGCAQRDSWHELKDRSRQWLRVATSRSSNGGRRVSRELGTQSGLTVMEDSVDLLSSDLALRCGDRGEAEVSDRGAVGVSLVKSYGRE